MESEKTESSQRVFGLKTKVKCSEANSRTLSYYQRLKELGSLTNPDDIAQYEFLVQVQKETENKA